mgnify:CR=1 FL=1
MLFRFQREQTVLRWEEGGLGLLVRWVCLAVRLGVGVWGPVYDADIVGKVVGGKSDPFYYYIVSVLQDVIPWSLILIGFVCYNT